MQLMLAMQKQSPLKSYRDAHDMTVGELAKFLGCERTTLFRWERDGVPLVRCQKVAKRMGIPLHELRPDVFPSEAAA